MKQLDGVEDVFVDQAAGAVHVKCADGTALTEQQVADAIQADDRFEVTSFEMQTPGSDAAPEEEDTTPTSWVDDATITQAHLQVTGMT